MPISRHSRHQLLLPVPRPFSPPRPCLPFPLRVPRDSAGPWGPQAKKPSISPGGRPAPCRGFLLCWSHPVPRPTPGPDQNSDQPPAPRRRRHHRGGPRPGAERQGSGGLRRAGRAARCAAPRSTRRPRTASFRQAAQYREGRKVRNSRSARAMCKRTRYGQKEAESSWIDAEVETM